MRTNTLPGTGSYPAARPPDHPPGWNNLSEKEKRKYEKKQKKPKNKTSKR